jgi:hypothetical protein
VPPAGPAPPPASRAALRLPRAPGGVAGVRGAAEKDPPVVALVVRIGLGTARRRRILYRRIRWSRNAGRADRGGHGGREGFFLSL